MAPPHPKLRAWNFPTGGCIVVNQLSLTLRELQVSLGLQLAGGLAVLHQAGLSTRMLAPLGVDTVACSPPPSDAIVLTPFKFSSGLCTSGASLQDNAVDGQLGAADSCVAPEEDAPVDLAACQCTFNPQKVDVWRSAAGDFIFPMSLWIST